MLNDTCGMNFLFNVQNVQCANDSNGATSTLIHGGSPPYSYLWSNGQTDSMATGLPMGTHSVSITDISGCVSSRVFSINLLPSGMRVNISQYSTTTDSVCDGNASANISGGTYPFSIQWSNGTTTSFNENLCEGTYFFTVTDATGCSIIDSVTILTLGAKFIKGNEKILILPNPSQNGKFTIQNISEYVEIMEVKNLFGETILSAKIQSQVETIDLSAFPDGIYFIKFKKEENFFIEKIIKFASR